MKRYLNYSLIAVAILSVWGCKEEFLELSDPNAVAANNYFKSESDVDVAVNGIYLAIRSGNALGEGATLYTDERSDDMGRNDNQSNAGEPFQFNDFSLLPGNTYLKRHWQALYTIIDRANFVINNIDKVQYKDEARKQTSLAEARYLRALAYFHLVRKWGDVPVVTEPIDRLTDLKARTYREKQAIVYALILEDLKAAAGSPLPDHQPASQKGRVSKVAANALLGEVYLTMGTNKAGTLAPAECFQQARNHLMAAYNARKFGRLNEIAYADVFDVNKKATNPEIIFQIVYKQGDPDLSSAVARNNQAKGETINSRFPSSGAGTRVNVDLIKEYETSDLRKDLSVKFANNAQVQDWFITKYRDASDAAGTSGYGGNDVIISRYADVLLMLAEANLHLNDQAAAIGFLDQVRERAGLPGYDASLNNAAYASAFPTLEMAILHERRVELAFEQKRWYDLIRFFDADELVAYFKTKKQGDYGVAKLANIGTKDRYYPIPFDEYKLDPKKMYQNPGY